MEGQNENLNNELTQQIQNLLQEIKNEQHPMEDDETLIGYIRDGIYDINQTSGENIDYEVDRKARSLLKNYVFYARFKLLAEFQQLYGGDYVNLQAKYYKTSDIH